MAYYYKTDYKYHHLQTNKKKVRGISIAQKMHGHASTEELKNFL